MDNKSIEMINSISATQKEMSFLVEAFKEQLLPRLPIPISSDIASLSVRIEKLSNRLSYQIVELEQELKGFYRSKNTNREVKRETREGIEFTKKQIFHYLGLLERDYPPPIVSKRLDIKYILTASNISLLSQCVKILSRLIACSSEDSEGISRDNSSEEKDKFNEITEVVEDINSCLKMFHEKCTCNMTEDDILVSQLHRLLTRHMTKLNRKIKEAKENNYGN